MWNKLWPLNFEFGEIDSGTFVRVSMIGYPPDYYEVWMKIKSVRRQLYTDRFSGTTFLYTILELYREF